LSDSATFGATEAYHHLHFFPVGRPLILFSIVVVGGLATGHAVSAAKRAPATPQADQLAIRGLLVQLGAADVGVVPTLAPAHFQFMSYSVSGSPPGLNVSFADARYSTTAASARAHAISYESTYFTGGPTRCGASSDETLRVHGEPVYVSSQSVWRCLTGPHGRVLKLSASGAATANQLAALLVSARRIP
jgi:hypothetical protein